MMESLEMLVLLDPLVNLESPVPLVLRAALESPEVLANPDIPESLDLL